MGASISFDSKYKLLMDIDVECFTLYPATQKKHVKKHKQSSDQESESGSESGSDTGSETKSDASESGSEAGSGSGSGSDSEGELQRVPVKITPEIADYIKTYIKSTEFKDIIDDITEIDLEPYEHAPDTALVFDTTTFHYDSNNKCIDAIGTWDYIPPKASAASSSKNKKKNSSTSGGDDGESNNGKSARSKRNSRRQDDEITYKTKDDEMSISEIQNIIRDRLTASSANNDFVIHKSKANMLMLNISNLEITKE